MQDFTGPFYLYAIGRATPNMPEILEHSPVDGAGQPFTLSMNGLVAVMSGESKDRYPISRKNLLAHKNIVEQVIRITPSLPVRFNTVAPSLELIKKRLLTEKVSD